MDFDLKKEVVPMRPLAPQYQLLPWRPELLRAHAEAKYRSFREELDTSVFSCLGRQDGCMRLMQDISTRSGFIAESTWLAICRHENGNIETCGTIQGIQIEPFLAAIQNIGITPAHRGQGLGSNLVQYALRGFQETGMKTGTLEVTAHNTGAIRLYQRLGFRITKTVFKSADFSYH